MMSTNGHLDPQVEALLAKIATRNLPELYQLSPDKARAQYRDGIRPLAGNPPDIAHAKDMTIATPAGTLNIRVYRPIGATTRALPALIYFHGGGWSFGDLDSHDHVCRWLCAGANIVVIATEYRLAPEHKFPAAVDDAIGVVTWLYEHGMELNIDGDRLAVGGDSAGATLAAATCHHARDTNGPPIRFQLLIYPATDMTMSLPSHAQFGSGYRLTRPLMIWSLANYLRNGIDALDPRTSPLFSQDFAGLPPATVITAGFDPLRDEGQAYANKLEAAGVAVRYRCYDGMIHGFISMPGALQTAKVALRDLAADLRTALAF